MVKVSFKYRTGSRTVQLVRQPYSPAAGRSVTRTVGSLDIDADPELLPYGIRVVAGEHLDDVEIVEVARWLRDNGDRVAAHRRGAWRAEFLARIRRELTDELVGKRASAIDAAAAALHEATGELEAKAREALAGGRDPWALLRDRYLAVYRAWSDFAKVAQVRGVAKKTKRRARAAD